MSDISKCIGHNCSLKETCYRYTAPQSLVWQSWLAGVPFKDGKCKYYWETEIKSYERRETQNNTNQTRN